MPTCKEPTDLSNENWSHGWVIFLQLSITSLTIPSLLLSYLDKLLLPPSLWESFCFCYATNPFPIHLYTCSKWLHSLFCVFTFNLSELIQPTHFFIWTQMPFYLLLFFNFWKWGEKEILTVASLECTYSEVMLSSCSLPALYPASCTFNQLHCYM